MAADRIQFEITETVRIRNMDAALDFVRSARAYGCKLALDDFGSGLSTFLYLKTLPVDCIKIDGAIVTDFADPGSIDRAIINSIVGLAKELGLRVVAEHVDNHDLLAALRQAGIDSVQGYLLSEPMPFRKLFDSADEALDMPLPG